MYDIYVRYIPIIELFRAIYVADINIYHAYFPHILLLRLVFNQSRLNQRINSLHVIETDAVYCNPRFRSIPLDNYRGWGSRKRNYLLRDLQIIKKENNKTPRLLIFQLSAKSINK